MRIIRDIIETTLRNHGVEYTSQQLDEMAEKASSHGVEKKSIKDAIDTLEWVISPYLGEE